MKLHDELPAELQGELVPEVASLAVNPAVWVPRHQPLLPASEHESPAAYRETAGAVASI